MTSETCEPLVKDDDWRQVKDPKKRKQIQDRLAQRARRKRLAEQKAHRPEAEHPVQETADDRSFEELSSVSVCKVRCHGRSVVTFGAFTSVPMIISGSQTFDVVVPKVMDEAHLPVSSQSAFAALFDNGQLLGLSCSTVNRSRSQYDCTNLPKYLQPSELQRKMAHPQWIDRFPFPYMRDTCISLLDTSGEEEFLGDLFKLTSLVVLPGYATWNSAGWVITTTFKEKWGHLFFPDESNAIDST